MEQSREIEWDGEGAVGDGLEVSGSIKCSVATVNMNGKGHV